MNLPEMLREQDPLCERRSVTPEEWQTNGKWTQYGIGAELAALVEAADDQHAVIEVEWHSHMAACACALCAAKIAYSAARAALVAKIGGAR